MEDDEEENSYYNLNKSLKEITIRNNTNLEEYLKILDKVKDIDTSPVHDEDENQVFHDALGGDHLNIADSVVNFDLFHIADVDEDDTEDMGTVRDIYYTFIKNYLIYNKKANHISFFENDSTKKCFYFKYWFYDYLIKNHIPENNINDIFSILFDKNGGDDTLKGYIKQHSETCPINRMELDKIRNIKILYDYLENYKDDTNKTHIEKKIKESKCCNSFNELIKEYNKKDACVSTDNNNYCSELKYCRKIYKGIELKVLECVNNGESKEPVSSEDGGATTMDGRGKGKSVEETRGEQSDNEVSEVSPSKGDKTEKTVKPDFLKLAEQLEVLKKTSFYDLYIKFDGKDRLEEHASMCSPLQEKTSSKSSEFQDICKKLFRNYEILKGQSDYNEKKCEKCKYLNYWFYDQVLTHKFTHEYVTLLIDKWKEKYNDQTGVNGCPLDNSDKNCDKYEILETYNEFYEYYKKTDMTKADEAVPFSKLYLNYISGCTNKDEKIKKICSENGTLLCKLLKENICSIERENSLCTMENTVLSTATAQGLPNTRAHEEMNGHADLSGAVNEYLPRAGSEHLPHAESDNSRVFMSKIVTPSCGALGFTPIGSHLGSRKKTMSEMPNYFGGEIDGLPFNNPEQTEQHAGERQYHIRYSSMHNS